FAGHLLQGVLAQDEVMLDTVCAEMQVVKKIKKTLSLQQDIMLSSPLTMVSKLLLKYYQSTLMDLLIKQVDATLYIMQALLRAQLAVRSKRAELAVQPEIHAN
ncbi:hypothetical protein Tco_1038624, partial [Tanacetum coccineum]